MFFIPGVVISAVTFPGVIVHELAHAIFCKLLRIPIYDAKFFQLSNPCGYVVHEPTDKPLKSLLISVGPFLVNTILGAVIMLPASITLIKFREPGNFLTLLLGWLGISILMHAFPSTGDAEALISSVLKNDQVNFLFKVITFPFIIAIYIGAFGSVVWLDALYALGVSMVLPNILVKLLY